MNTIPLSTVLQRDPLILTQAAGGTVVLLNVQDGRYYALDEVGGRIWELCDGSHTLTEPSRR